MRNASMDIANSVQKVMWEDIPEGPALAIVECHVLNVGMKGEDMGGEEDFRLARHVEWTELTNNA